MKESEYSQYRSSIESMTTWRNYCTLMKVPKRYTTVCENECLLPPEMISGINFWISDEDRDSLLFLGPPGRGKTWLMYFTVKNYLDRLRALGNPDISSIKIMSMTEFELCVQKDLDRYKSFVGLVDYLAHIPVLLIDDVCCFELTKVLYKALYQIIDLRLANKLPTVLSSNLSYGELCNVLQDRIRSRFNEYKVLNFKDLPELRGKHGCM